jgi:glucokinase
MMAKTIGVVLSERVITGLIVDHKVVGDILAYPLNEENESALVELHTEGLVETICKQVRLAQGDHKDVTAVGVAMPGLIKEGARIMELLSRDLKEHGLDVPVRILNDADGVAAGLAATQGKLDQFLRVWTLGVGIGYGRYPFAPGVWEGGHTIVTLDDKENFCGCGGRGHLEGIMGHRAMRLRFLDMEPEEVFAEAAAGNKRCLDFKRLWHKALAAGIASRVHMEGAGKFFLTGFNSRFVDMPMLKDYIHQMVKMSPLQSYTLEIVADDPVTRVIGAAVAAEQAALGRL